MKFPYGLADFPSLRREGYYYAVVSLGFEQLFWQEVTPTDAQA